MTTNKAGSDNGLVNTELVLTKINELELSIANTKRSMIESAVIFMLMIASSYAALNSDFASKLVVMVVILNSFLMFLCIRDICKKYISEYKPYKREIEGLLMAIEILRK